MPRNLDTTWLQLVFSRPILVRSLLCPLIVGPILFLIHHLDCCIVGGRYHPICVFKGLMTAAVPFTVSTVSNVLAIRRRD